jgi:hypothetical protein
MHSIGWSTSLFQHRELTDRSRQQHISQRLSCVKCRSLNCHMLSAQHGAAGLAPSIWHQALGAQIMQISIYTQKRIGQHSSVKVCTPVVQGKIPQTICRRSRVRVLLTIFLNGSTTDCTSMKAYDLGMYIVIMSYLCLCKYIPVCTGLYWSVPVQTSSWLVCTCPYQYIQVYTKTDTYTFNLTWWNWFHWTLEYILGIYSSTKSCYRTSRRKPSCTVLYWGISGV